MHVTALASPRLAIAGTGTDVGKTFVGCRLVTSLRASGLKVLALKPIETGFTSPLGSDAHALSVAAGHAFIAPLFSFRDPVAPMRAAHTEQIDLDLHLAEDWVRQLEAQHAPDLTVIETAGGLFTPLSHAANNLDLIDAVRASTWLLVAANRLGALHDVLSVMAASSRCSAGAVYLNDHPQPGPATNREDLKTCGVSHVLDRVDELAAHCGQWLARL